MINSTYGMTTDGYNGIPVSIECVLSNNLPFIVIVGQASKAVSEAKERLRGAFAQSNLQLPRKRITINLAPADVPKHDSDLDLAIAISILIADKQLQQPSEELFIGELGLNGDVHAVRGIIRKLVTAREHGFKACFIPHANLDQCRLVPRMLLYPVDNLRQLIDHLNGIQRIKPVNTAHTRTKTGKLTATTMAFSNVAGQPLAKRALLIAAAGGHNVMLTGPPGTGKTMLAKGLAAILPPLNREELLEVTHLHSLTNSNYNRLITQRPFRQPHHTSSVKALCGGGSPLKPGELSLAHSGVLFLDELPEFQRSVIEVLRQPLEDRMISLARVKGTAVLPASFILVATANPCPCGYYGTDQECRCQPYQVIRYQQKLSGPFLDRIDLFVTVNPVAHDQLLKQNDTDNDAPLVRAVVAARSIQLKRNKNTGRLNADMTNADVASDAALDTETATYLQAVARQNNLSPRAYIRTIKVARTIADLDGAALVTKPHVLEALAYRQFDP